MPVTTRAKSKDHLPSPAPTYSEHRRQSLAAAGLPVLDPTTLRVESDLPFQKSPHPTRSPCEVQAPLPWAKKRRGSHKKRPSTLPLNLPRHHKTLNGCCWYATNEEYEYIEAPTPVSIHHRAYPEPTKPYKPPPKPHKLTRGINSKGRKIYNLSPSIRTDYHAFVSTSQFSDVARKYCCEWNRKGYQYVFGYDCNGQAVMYDVLKYRRGRTEERYALKATRKCRIKDGSIDRLGEIFTGFDGDQKEMWAPILLRDYRGPYEETGRTPKNIPDEVYGGYAPNRGWRRKSSYDGPPGRPATDDTLDWDESYFDEFEDMPEDDSDMPRRKRSIAPLPDGNPG